MSTHSLPRDTNQARALGEFARDFLADRFDEPADQAYRKVEQFHADSIACAISAIACGTNAPTVLRAEALDYARSAGATCIGSSIPVAPEKAIAANCAASREWDANGTNFGYRPALQHTAGEFGHNDFYPVVMAAAQLTDCNGRKALKAMLLLDEIRGRLAEVFALRNYKIDHVVHGAIASAAVYGAMLGATAEQIESAIGMVVAHYIPFRAIRAGHQLSDSKGASAALSTEMAVVSMQRAMRGFLGPADIFRNPQAIFCLFEPPEQQDCSPFDLVLGTSGSDFAVLDMHFKLGLYEHQSAGAIQGLVNLLEHHQGLTDSSQQIKRIEIEIYEPAFSIIGDPAKRDPHTRQSADHSMIYIIATLLRKALQSKQTSWEDLMLLPEDYSQAALFDPTTRELMQKMHFRHGGKSYDEKYPDGIPTSLTIEHTHLGRLESGLVMYPLGHARNDDPNFDQVFATKFQRLAALGVEDVPQIEQRFSNLLETSAEAMKSLYDFPLKTTK